MRNTALQDKKAGSKKLLLCIGIPVGTLLAIILGVLLYVRHAVHKFRSECTEEKPAVIQHAPVTQRQQSQLNAKYNSLKDVLTHHKATDMEFTSQEFSQLMAFSPETKSIADKAKFWLEEDKIKAELSLPLSQIPQMQGRYLNGLFTFSVAVQNQKMRLHIDDCLVRGRPMNPKYLKLLNSQNLEQLLADRTGANWSEFIETLEVANGKLRIKTR